MHRLHAVNRCITQLHVQVRIPLMSPEPDPVEKSRKEIPGRDFLPTLTGVRKVD